jgi:hypothetical protein
MWSYCAECVHPRASVSPTRAELNGAEFEPSLVQGSFLTTVTEKRMEGTTNNESSE